MEDGPVNLVSRDVGRGCVLGVFHLIREDEEVVFNIGEAFGRRFALRGVSDGGHG